MGRIVELSLQYTNLASEFFVLPLISLEVADQDVDAALFVHEVFFEASLLAHEVRVSNLQLDVLWVLCQEGVQDVYGLLW